MKHTRLIASILVLALLLPCFTVAGSAAEGDGFSVAVTAGTAAIGGEATVTVSLEGYDTASIAGLQVDITGFDADVLQVASCDSLIEDAGAASNKASYNTAKDRVRLLYFRTSGTLAPCEDVLKLVVRIDPDLTEAGSVTLPVTVKAVTADSRQIVQTASCTITYAASTGAARNTTTQTEYETVAEALVAARAGETVIVLADCAENRVLVTPGVTLDLNGHTLTANYVVGFGGADIIDTTGNGLLAADQNSVVLDEDNAYVPVWNTVNGYTFTQLVIVDSTQGMGLEMNGDKAVFRFVTFFRNTAGMTDGVTDNDLSVVIRVSWTTANGTAYQDFVYNDTHVGTVVQANGKQAFQLTFTGCTGLKNLTFTPVVLSETGARFCGSTHSAA